VSRLKELRLHGFKTFADPTRFVFEPGVNAVIGPNGSGKSNMADAVRWVLGEQSNRSLRTRRADDVIFAGSESRKPQGMAEALLTLDNADGWLPIDFGEVTIGRRAYRSGETEYLINGARARLRDVVELLAAGRLGANELVVVGQGTVDAALSLRPEERRQLFEEAAGVKNLQVRKNEALSRLAAARLNLTRVSDVIGELRPQVRRLALQAQHQQEHDSLGRRARALIHESHRRREIAARSLLGEARRRAAAAELALEALRTAEAAAGAAIAAAEERYWAAEETVRLAAAAHQDVRDTRIRAEARVEAATGRVAELRAGIERARGELTAAEAELEGNELPERDEGVAQALAEARDREAAWQAAVTALGVADADLLASEEALAAVRHRESRQIAGAARRDEMLTRARARTERISAELATARQAVERAEVDLAPALAAQSAAEDALRVAGRQVETAAEALSRAEAEAEAARQLAAELAARQGALEAELDALRERTEVGGHLGVRLAAAGWRSVLESMDAPEEAWPAMEAVVGGDLGQALLWRDADLGESVAEARGAARLLMPAEMASPDGGNARQAALDSVGGSRTLADWVGSAAAPALFHRIVVAPDLAALLSGWRALPTGWSAVTPRGDLADARGLVSVRGQADPPGGESARLHARRRDIATELKNLEHSTGDALAAAARLLAAAGEARRSQRELEEQGARAEDVARQARASVEQIDGALGRARRDVVERSAELAAVGAETEALDADQATAGGQRDDLAVLADAAQAARLRRDAAAADLDAARAAWQVARSAAHALELGTTEAHGRRAALAANVGQLQRSIPAQEAALAASLADEASALAALHAAHAADEEQAAGMAAIEAERERLRAELLVAERERSSSGSRRLDLERDSQAAAIEASRAEESLSALARERELALESLPIDPAAGPDEPLEPPTQDAAEWASIDEAEIEAELRRVRRTLSQLGSVNPFAVEEHAEMAARLDGLTSQDADLTAAIGSAEQLIARLDADIAGRFDAAFAAIGTRFDEFCKLLFAGGSASLQMAEAQDGESAGGIEIVVQPPGKRPQRLAMLSGGERALTGVALLFAMLSVNPVPFCILDEVDAALDEANIGRFADALRVLSQDTDFVVVTHNRATIEVADTIYGVTMTDAAVSRVLSLRLADIPAEVLIG